MMHSMMTAKTLEDVCSLKRDNFSRGDFTILSDGQSVFLSEQKLGEWASQDFTIPRTVFNYLLKHYMRQTTGKRGRKPRSKR